MASSVARAVHGGSVAQARLGAAKIITGDGHGRRAIWPH